MGKTLFWYVFWNLLRVFGMASAVIAGIMSFGGLLKPLMDNGLNLGQVVKMLGYAMPAMTTYSYPIAALFACTVVYGRLAADNEVTAVRAAGISMGPWGLGRPALVLGIIVSIASLGALSYVVPKASLGMERTVVSNLGQLVVNRITQQHQIQLVQTGSQPLTIYARAAQLEPSDPNRPGEQVVTLDGVSIVTFEKTNPGEKKLAVPEEFYLAKTARAYIRQPDVGDEDEGAPVQLLAQMESGLKFPRQVAGRQDAAMQGGMQTTQFGPFPLQSPLRENTKFMDIAKLQDLRFHPEKSRRMQASLQTLIEGDQQSAYLKALVDNVTNGDGVIVMKSVSGDRYTLRPGKQPPKIDKNRLVFDSTFTDGDVIKLIQTRGDNVPSQEWWAKQIRVRLFPDNETKQLVVSLEMQDAELHGEGIVSPRNSKEINFAIAMPEAVADIANTTVKAYIARSGLPAGDPLKLPVSSAQLLYRNLLKQNNSVESEMHSRISFAISCLVLTLVGYALGVMFKSGNYLNAFAVSVVPAIVSIVLVVTGQHVCENVPPNINPQTFKDPLYLGLSIVWAGNVAVTILAVVLLNKLRRT
ncbi:MAG: LptF/LptG family permease [Tepidisphaeraceae bacterium]